MDQSDEELIRMLQAGSDDACNESDDACNEIVVRYGPLIHSFLIRKGADYHTAFDVTQELWLIVYRKRLYKYDSSKGKLVVYLCRAALNLWQRQNRPISPPMTLDEMLAAVSEERVSKAITELAPKHRTILQQHREGRSSAEIAQHLGIKAKAVQERLRTARRALQNQLGLGPRFTELHDTLPSPTTDETAEEMEQRKREMEQRIREALTGLPQEYREVLELLLHNPSLTPAKIAESLKIPVKRVYRVLNKARRMLAEQLGLTLPPSKRGRPRKKETGDAVSAD